MNRLVSIAGILLALAFMSLSAAINWRYGHSIGRDAGDQLIYASISMAADIAKAITPFFCWYALKNRRFGPAAASALFWIACTGYSLSSAAGFAELNRAEQTGGFATRKADHAGLQVELSRKEAQLKALGAYEPPAVIAQQLEVLRQNPRWASSKQCTEATARESRSFCAGYHTLEAARQKGVEAANLESEIASLRSRIGGLAGAARVSEGDPRAGFIVHLTGWDALRIQTGFSLLFIAVLEIGSGLGLFIALNHGEFRRPAGSPTAEASLAVAAANDNATAQAPAEGAPPAALGTSAATQSNEATSVEQRPAQLDPVFGDVAKFARARLVGAAGEALAFDDLFAAYAAWCGEQGLKALARADFNRRFLLLCGTVGFQYAKRGRKHVCLDLKLNLAP